MIEPAFPFPRMTTPDGYSFGPCAGMELRDYFAAKAMQALIARMNESEFEKKNGFADIAGMAFVVADLMMIERDELC
jgi:hypothetical protein